MIYTFALLPSCFNFEQIQLWLCSTSSVLFSSALFAFRLLIILQSAETLKNISKDSRQAGGHNQDRVSTEDMPPGARVTLHSFAVIFR